MIKKINVNWKYCLTEDTAIQTNVFLDKGIETSYIRLTKEGLLTAKVKYCWDGPSGPVPDFQCLMLASLFHDCLYQLIRLELIPQNPYRYYADSLFASKAVDDGCPWILAELLFHGLQIFGKSFASYQTDVDRFQK